MTPLTETGWLGPTGALLAAPAIGFVFGWFLERGGLGSAPKLAGQFYLTDFTVFKVMFSALLTAMLGAFWLDRLGVLQLELVYLPETFALPQAIGGALFGVGFLIAGLCPGTSCVAAATGRRDGLGVIAGMLLGVGAVQRDVRVDRTALLRHADGGDPPDRPGRCGARRWHRRPDGPGPGWLRGGRPHRARPSVKRLHVALALVAAIMAAAAGAADLASPAEPAGARASAFIAAPELAERIMSGDGSLRLFDLRPAAAYQQFHIPTARRVEPADLSAGSLSADADVVLYGDSRATLSDAVRVLRTRRQAKVLVLREGVSEWLGRVHEPRLAVDATPEERAQFDRAAAMSRFFGGVPLAGVPRSEVPSGTGRARPAPTSCWKQRRCSRWP